MIILYESCDLHGKENNEQLLQQYKDILSLNKSDVLNGAFCALMYIYKRAKAVEHCQRNIVGFAMSITILTNANMDPAPQLVTTKFLLLYYTTRSSKISKIPKRKTYKA